MRDGGRSRAAQSAMEYLMTYGWAILILAVVLGALYELGFFNPYVLTPRVQAGDCKVVRSGGPWTPASALQGSCNKGLPQYVAYFTGTQTAGINGISDFDFPSGTQPVSLFMWIKPTSMTTDAFLFNYGNYGTAYENWNLEFYSNNLYVDTWNNGVGIYYPLADGNWHFVGFTYAGGSAVAIYVDGKSYSVSGSTPAVNTGTGTSANIGYGCCGGMYAGYIANVQLYNTSLTAGEANSLYHSGIGGAPVNIGSLVGWWPLNGDAKDYSGNNNNGNANAGMSFSGSWTNGYGAP